jgi:hypothetical protein
MRLMVLSLALVSHSPGLIVYTWSWRQNHPTCWGKFSSRLIGSPSAVSSGCWIWSPFMLELSESHVLATSLLFWKVSV